MLKLAGLLKENTESGEQKVNEADSSLGNDPKKIRMVKNVVRDLTTSGDDISRKIDTIMSRQSTDAMDKLVGGRGSQNGPLVGLEYKDSNSGKIYVIEYVDYIKATPEYKVDRWVTKMMVRMQIIEKGKNSGGKFVSVPLNSILSMLSNE